MIRHGYRVKARDLKPGMPVFYHKKFQAKNGEVVLETERFASKNNGRTMVRIVLRDNDDDIKDFVCNGNDFVDVVPKDEEISDFKLFFWKIMWTLNRIWIDFFNYNEY